MHNYLIQIQGCRNCPHKRQAPKRFGRCFGIQRWTPSFSLHNDNGTATVTLKHGQSLTRYNSVICRCFIIFMVLVLWWVCSKNKYLTIYEHVFSLLSKMVQPILLLSPAPFSPNSSSH